MSDDWGNDALSSAAAPAAGGDWGNDPVVAPAASADNSDRNDRAAAQANAAIDNADQNDRRAARGSPGAGEGEPNPEGFFGNLWSELKKTDVTENAFTRMSRYTNDVKAIWDSQKSAYDQGVAAGTIPPNMPLDDWMAQPANSPENIYTAQHGQAPELDAFANIGSLPKHMWEAVKNNPGQAVGSLARGLITDPELLWMPEFGSVEKVAALGKTAQTVARLGEAGAAMGAQSAGIDVAQQVQETGQANAGQAAVAAVQGAVGGMALTAAHVIPKVVLDSAKSLAGAIIDQKFPMSPETKAKIDAGFNDGVAKAKASDPNVSQNDAITKAFIDTTTAAGLDPKKAGDMGAALDNVNEAVQRMKEGGNATDTEGQQNPVGNDQGVRGEEGQVGVLREREQGTDQGSGPENQPPAQGASEETQALDDAIKAEQAKNVPEGAAAAVAPEQVPWEEAPHYDMRPREMQEADLAVQREMLKQQAAERITAPAPDAKPPEMPDAEYASLGGPQDAKASVEQAQAKGEISEPHANFLRWVLDKAPQLAKQVQIAFQKSEPGVHGWYNDIKSIITIAKNGASDVTGVHELMHHAERMMPESLQDKVRQAWKRHVDSVYAAPEKFFPEHSMDLVRAALDVARTATNEGGSKTPLGLKALQAFQEYIKSGELPQSFYQFANPSEYWAENATRILGNRAGAQGWGAVKQWTRELGEHLKNIVGRNSDSPVLRALDNVLSGKGELLPGAEMMMRRGPVTDGMPRTGMLKVAGQMGLTAGITGTAAYALTGDKSKAIGAAVAAGMLPLAFATVRALRLGTSRLGDMVRDNSIVANSREIFRNNVASRQVMNYAVSAWQNGVEKLLGNLKGAERDAAYTRIRDYIQGHRDVALSPLEQKVAGEVSAFLDHMGEAGQSSRVLRDLRENYLPGLYRKPPLRSWSDVYDALTQAGAFKGNYTGMSPRSRFALQKIIPDYRTVEALNKAGKLDIVPITNNPIEMAGRYGRSLTKTIANARLMDELMHAPGDHFKFAADGSQSPIPLMVPNTTGFDSKRFAQTLAIMQKQLGFSDDTKRMMLKFATMSAPNDYVRIDHPSLEGVRVHKDIAVPMRMIYDSNNPNVLAKAALGTSMAAKSLLFSFSLFHAGSLLTNAAVISARHPMYMWKGLRTAFDAVNLDKGTMRPEMTRFLNAGLVLAHGIEDVDPAFAQRALEFVDNTMRATMGEKLGAGVALPVRGVAFLQRAINSFLWDQLHPTLKLGTALAMSERWTDRVAAGREKVTDPKLADQQIAKSVNDIYGGLNWFNMVNDLQGPIARNFAAAILGPQGRRIQQMLWLAPDWNIAAVRGWTEAAKAALPGIEAKASDHLYRTYLVASGLATLAAQQYLQKKFTGENIWDKADWSQVDMGDGRHIQTNKHFMEMVHLVTQPQKFVLNKMGYLPKEALTQLFGKEYLTYVQGQGVVGPNMREGRLAHAAKDLVTPIAANNLGDPGSLLGGFLGFPITGKTYQEQAASAAATATKNAEAKGKNPASAARSATRAVQRRQAKDEAARAANRNK